MKKHRHAILLVLCTALIAGMLTGCADFIRIDLLGMDPAFVAYLDAPEQYVIFRGDHEGSAEENLYVPMDEILAYQSQYPDCNGTYFRDQLTGEDLAVYNAHLYALENSHGYFEMHVANNEKDFTYIREYLSLDTPFLEQNFNSEGETTWLWDNGTRIGFSMEQFTQSRWELKMQALASCRNIVANLPEGLNQEQTMLHLYRYVCDRVEYITYEDGYDQDFLYDAVCMGKSNCDGYSNMLALLYNLAGINCCEAMGSELEDPDTATEEELKASSGHTWVVAEIDGAFYNFDPTYEDSTEDFAAEPPMYFRFSDELVDMVSMDCDLLRPRCTDTAWDFDFTQLTVENITDKQQIRKIAQYTDQQAAKGNFITFVLVTSPVPDDAFDIFWDSYTNLVYNISYISGSSVDFDHCSVIRFVTEPW